MSAALMAMIRSVLRRGRIVKTTLNAKRAMVQLDGRADETRDKIELMLPYGFSARPAGGADVIVMQIGGSASHLVVLCADDPALRIGDLQEGEFGWKDRNGQQIVFRTDKIEITTPEGKKVVMTVGGDLEQTVTGNVTQTVQGNATQTVQGDVSVTAQGDVTVSAQGAASVTASGNATVTGAAVLLGGGSKKVALDGDPVVAGKVVASSTVVKAS